MGLSWNDKERQWEWEGSVRDLVAAVGNGDARLGFVLDKKSGAKISMNISDDFGGEATEPFYVLAADGENMYDAYNGREAAQMLANARDDMKHLDTDEVYRVPKRRKSRSSKAKSAVRGLKGVRR